MLTIAELRRLSKILKISVIAKEAGLNQNTLRAKIIFDRELSVVESDIIKKYLQKNGIELIFKK